MGLLSSLLDPGFRQAASVVVEVGQDRRDIGEIADLISNIEIVATRTEAATGMIQIDDRRREDGTWMAADSGQFGLQLDHIATENLFDMGLEIRRHHNRHGPREQPAISRHPCAVLAPAIINLDHACRGFRPGGHDLDI